MRCSACGADNDEAARFCIECGTPRQPGCPHCGARTPTGAKFCPDCGGRLTPDPAPAVPAVATPDHLAEKIVRLRPELEGERKQVTVLFADVQGSMDLQEDLDPEDWHRVVNRFFAILCDGVHRFEGTVDKFTGDGIMALFGAPIAHEDHAQRACFAALHLMDQLSAYATEVRRSHGLSFSVRMGLNSGEVVVGGVGDDLVMEYTAVGHTVGLAARMEALAQADSTFLTHATARLVDGYFQLDDLGEFAVKGVTAPVRTYRLVGVGPMRGRLDASRARGFTRFVGRASEMEVLDDALESALAGDAQVVAVVGEAGVGKSRLCYEFAQRCRSRGIPVRAAGALPHAAAVPLGVVLELLRDVFGIGAHEEPQQVREKVAGRLLLQDAAFDAHLPLLFDFLGVGDPERPAPQLDPTVRQRALAQLFKQMTHTRSGFEPSVFVLDDLHWIDGASASFVESFVDALPATRTLVLANYRPEYRPEWIHRTFVRQVPLRPLGPDALAELLQELLGEDPSVAGLAPAVLARTGGNPFFAEEVVRSLAESGALDGRPGSYRLVAGADLGAIPASVEALLAARIDRLDEEQKLVLQAASVVGTSVAQPVLERVAGLPTPDTERALRALTTAEFLREEAVYPVARFEFVHALTHDVAYRSQLTAQRRRSHAQAAHALIELFPSAHDEQAALIAHHLEGAGERRQAASWAARAAAWAGRTDLGEAERRWRTSAELLRGETDEEALALRARSLLYVLMLGSRRGIPRQEVEALYAEGLEAAEAGGDRQTLAFVHQAYGSCRAFASSDPAGLPDAAAASERSLHITEQLDDPEAVVMSAAGYGIFQMFLGRPRRGLEVFERALAAAPEEVPRHYRPLGYVPRVFLHANWCFVLTEVGRLVEAEHHGDVGLRLAAEVDDPIGSAMTEHALAWVAVAVGDGGRAMAHAANALPFFERSGNVLFANSCLIATGDAHGLLGDVDQACEVLGRGIALLDASGVAPFEAPLGLCKLSHHLLGAGRSRDALAAADDAIRRSEAASVGCYLPGALVARARALVAIDPAATDEATRALDRADALIDDSGLETTRPHVLEARADVAARAADEASHRRFLDEARRLFHEQGAHAHAARLADLVS